MSSCAAIRRSRAGARRVWLAVLLASALAWSAPLRAHAEPGPEPASITLRELMRRALREPPRVLVALAALERAEAAYSASQASYLPSLTLQATAGVAYDNRQQVPNGVLDLIAQIYKDLYDADLGVNAARGRLDSVTMQTAGTASLDWSLVNLARRKVVQSARLSREAQLADAHGVSQKALAAACELYLRALASSALVADAELTYARRSQQYEGISGLVQAGLRPPVDEARARIEKVAAEHRLEVRRVEERAAFAALAVSVGRAPERPLRPEPLAEELRAPERTLSEAIAHALGQRPELVSLARTLEARQADLQAAIRRRLPTLGILGNGSISYIDQLKGQGYQGSQYSATALGYLRFQGFDASVWRSADVARGAMLEAQRALEAASLEIQGEVAEAKFAVDRARAELERATQVLAAAQVAREAQHGRYKSGVASLLELLDAEAVEQNARLDRIQAERDHRVAQIRLLAATGGLRALAEKETL